MNTIDIFMFVVCCVPINLNSKSAEFEMNILVVCAFWQRCYHLVAHATIQLDCDDCVNPLSQWMWTKECAGEWKGTANEKGRGRRKRAPIYNLEKIYEALAVAILFSMFRYLINVRCAMCNYFPFFFSTFLYPSTSFIAKVLASRNSCICEWQPRNKWFFGWKIE